MKFFVFALLVFVCFEGFYCAPLFEAFVPESSQMSYGGRTDLDLGRFAHFKNERAFNWNVMWPERNPQRQIDHPQESYGYPQRSYGYPQRSYGYPQRSYGYPQQYNEYPQQYEQYPQRAPNNNYEGQNQ